LIKPEHRIFFALKDASQGYGFNINNWFLEKPVEFNINCSDFQSLIDRLEKEGVL